MKRLKSVILSVTLLAGAASACASPHATGSTSAPAPPRATQSAPEPPTGAAKPDPAVPPCSLIPPKALAAAAGTAPVEGKPLPNGYCDYRMSSGSLTVAVDHETGKVRHQAARENYQSATTVTGIGDDAFLSPADHRCSVLEGNTQVLLTLFVQEGTFDKACTELMRTAVQHL
ncbi:hypothetical protein ACGFT2_24075 [Streptomyces sp. NPDC048514]|uniref:hypothetical protein n=1 Tax=Streptomyces sp. NPDC048514 TaxID=3365564 RepID=UPI00371F0B7C